MKKAFLSHSSSDKVRYVEKVAKRLGAKAIIDSMCFEDGMKNMEEIVRNMELSDLFVIFISRASLNSKWVKTELQIARKYEREGVISRIYPIIIEPNLRHDDPIFAENKLEWLTTEYNLKYNARPATAARRITQRLIELTWEEDALTKHDKLFFSGRNDLIGNIEDRLNDYDLAYPEAVIASGIPHIGRRSLLAHCFRKYGLYTESYTPSNIHLSGRQGIDDFILGINGLAIANEIPCDNLLAKSNEQKLVELNKAISEIDESKDTILIIDDGAIVLKNGELSEWFEKLLVNQQENTRTLFQVVSRFRLYKKGWLNKHKPFVFAVDVPELNEKDRKGLLKQMLEKNGIKFSPEQFNNVSSQLKGLPEEVFYIIEVIKDKGVEYLTSHLSIISDFRSERIISVIKEIRQEERDFQFLNLLAQFPSFSFEFLSKIETDESYSIKTLEKLSLLNILEYIGSKDYMRINDAVADYISRLHIEITDTYKERIEALANSYVKQSMLDFTDLSEFYFIAKEILYSGKNLPEQYLIPSILLNTIADTYERKRDFQKVILLSERILANREIKDQNILRETRYWLCLALARERNSDRFFEELHGFDNTEKNFLLGFYHRLMGNIDLSIEYILKSLEHRPNFKRAKSELVNAYISNEDYSSAIDMAEEAYEYAKNNPYNIHNYLRCLIITRSNEQELIERLLEELQVINTEKSNEMYLLTKARFLSISLDKKAYDLINEALNCYKDSFYPILAMLEISERFKDVESLEKYFKELEKMSLRRTWLNKNVQLWRQRLKDLRNSKH